MYSSRPPDTRLRARDHCTSSTPIGGKGGPVQVRTMFEGPREYVNAKWM
jgi:hypothetical protein